MPKIPTRLDPDNRIVGENLRAIFDEYNAARTPKTNIDTPASEGWQSIGTVAKIDSNTLANALSGPRKPSSGPPLTWRSVASRIPLHHITLANALSGKHGLSEDKILRLADIFGVHPGRIVARTSPERFPHISSPNSRNTQDTRRKGLAVGSIEKLIKTPRILSSFFGGIADKDILLFQRLLLDLKTIADTKRKAAIEEGRFDVRTGKFTD